jgi:hypothetical protein
MSNGFSLYGGIPGGLGGDLYGMPAQELHDLTKALGTGQLVNGALGTGYVDGGSAFRVQSLEGILKVMTWQEKNIVLWRDIPKMQAYNTTEEFNRLIDYGGTGDGFMIEGGIPVEQTSAYDRVPVLMRFMGEVGVVTHQLTLVTSAHGDIIGREAKNRTLSLLKKLEYALFFGSNTVNPIAFDGIERQIIDNAPENVLDLRGAPVDEDVLENIAQIVADNYGVLTTLYGGNKTFTDIAKQVLPNGRYQMPYGDREGRLGYRVTAFDSQVGSYALVPDVFLRPGGIPKSIGDKYSPAAPTISGLSIGTQSGSLFTTTQDLYYAISAVNNDGESVVSAVVSGSVASGQGVSISVSAIPTNATAFRIYRGTTASVLKEMVTVAAATGVIAIDKNLDLPGTSKAFGLMMDSEQGLTFKQLAPLMKMDLAMISASYRFMVLLYGAPVVYSPKKMILIKNIGTL